jgi:hypothetical protein
VRIVLYVSGIDRETPNATRISRAAPIGWERLHVMIARTIGTILPPARRRAACAGWAAPRRRAALTCRTCWRPRAVPGIGVRMRFFPTLTGAMTVGCAACDHVRGPSRRFRSHLDGRRMRGLGWRSRAFPVLACPRTGCVARDGARMPDSRMIAVRLQPSRG